MKQTDSRKPKARIIDGNGQSCEKVKAGIEQ
jgi:hypothetical protein